MAETCTDGLRIHQASPMNAEVLPGAIGGAFYVRSHFAQPVTTADGWRLAVTGLVRRPLSLSLPELRAMRTRQAEITLECAGNGRAYLDPPVPGEQWGLGAVGTAVWTGVPLADVLALAGPGESAREMIFRGADRGTPEGRAGMAWFERSMTLAQALTSDALLAYEMDGAALPARHGYPLRLVVPGWYGVASVKWLTRITATDRPFTGFFQADRYCVDGEPLTLQRVRSVILAPVDRQQVRPGSLLVRGVAWSGAAPIARVEVSVDGGPWRLARAAVFQSPQAWLHWELQVTLGRAGRSTIRARATDQAGQRQPNEQRWNERGYANNAIQPVVVTVHSR